MRRQSALRGCNSGSRRIRAFHAIMGRLIYWRSVLYRRLAVKRDGGKCVIARPRSPLF